MIRSVVLALAILAAVAFYASFLFVEWLHVPPAELRIAAIVLLAIWAAMAARTHDGWLLAIMLTVSGLGQLLSSRFVPGMGLAPFLVALAIGHCMACVLFLRNRTGNLRWLVSTAIGISLAGILLTRGAQASAGLSLYALTCGAMAASLWFSRFARTAAGVGMVMYLVAQLLGLSLAGYLHGSEVPMWLIWPAYFSGLVLIVCGVSQALDHGAGREDLHHRL